MTRRTAGLAPVEHVELPAATRKSVQEELAGDDSATGGAKRKRARSGISGSPRKRIKHESDSADVLLDDTQDDEPTQKLEVIPAPDELDLNQDPAPEDTDLGSSNHVVEDIQTIEDTTQDMADGNSLNPVTDEGHASMDAFQDGFNTNMEQPQQDNGLEVKNESFQAPRENAQQQVNFQLEGDPTRNSEGQIPEPTRISDTEVRNDFYANSPITLSSSHFLADPSGWLKPKIQSILQQLATHILSVFSEVSLVDMQRLHENPQHAHHIESWRSLQATFLQARKIISPYLSYLNEVEPLNMGSGVIQQINLATALSTFVRPEVTMGGLAETHHMFLDIFCRLSGDLSPWQADLLYSIKLQVLKYRTANEPSARLRILDEIFPRNLEARLRISLKRHIPQQFSLTESDFLNRCLQTRESLDRAIPEFDVKDKNGNWKQVLEKIGPHCRSYVQRIMGIPLSDYPPREYQVRHHLNLQTHQPVTHMSPPGQVGLYEEMSSHAPPQPVPQPQTQIQNGYQPQVQAQTQSQSLLSLSEEDDGDDHVRRAALAAHAALLGSMSNGIRSAPSFGQFSSRPQNVSSENRQSPYLRQPSPSSQEALNHSDENSSQPFSTKEQYERARMAATAKAASKNKGSSITPSQRRPWSSEEEEALMSGLDRVQGPHWSAILAMYGTGGTVSEVLKDRNQVQLKDKARNLKLFFLKGGHEVPHYLQNVTGELKTRAPAQAAKNEVREKLQETGNEDRATADAISVLAAGRRSFTAVNGNAPADDDCASTTTSRSGASPSPVAIAATFSSGNFMQELSNSNTGQQSQQKDAKPISGDAGAAQMEEDQSAAADREFAQAIQLALAASRSEGEGNEAPVQQHATESLQHSSSGQPPQQPQAPAPHANGSGQAQSV